MSGKHVEKSELPEQIERISQVVGAVHAEIDNTFEENKTNLFVHMYADSLVIAQKNLIEGCARKLVEGCWRSSIRFFLIVDLLKSRRRLLKSIFRCQL